MLRALKIQLRILVAHGSLALCLGVALLCLSASMTNLLFEAVAVIIALLMASKALILGALADWVAAWGEGTKHLQRSTFYLLSGLAFATVGVFLGVYAPLSLQWLILLAAIHALAFGLLGIVIALRAKGHGWERRAVFLFGAVSIVFSGTMAGLARQLENRSATALLGVYFCFVGVKLFFLAWNLYQRITMGEAIPDPARGHLVLPFTLPPSPTTVKR
jgi:MFS family permease